jgi:hypothetical protein
MVELKKALESPVTVLFGEDYVEWHGLADGGPIKLDTRGASLDVTLQGYVVRIRVERRES